MQEHGIPSEAVGDAGGDGEPVGAGDCNAVAYGLSRMEGCQHVGIAKGIQ